MLNDNYNMLGEDEEEENWMDTWTDEVDQTSTGISGVAIIRQNVHNDTRSDVENNKPQQSPRKAGESELMSRMLLNDNKAGMEGLDKARINQIILEASKGSKYFENEKKKEEQVNKRIEEQMMKMAKISEKQLKQGQKEADRLLEEFECQRDLSHTIVHIDMDAFYAAVEMRDDPSLKYKPMAVGGNSMLSTSNYLARKFGVRAAMPGFIGKKLCPDLVIVPANFDKYSSVSKDIRSIFADYDLNFCPMSLDEAYLDITEHLVKRNKLQSAERTFLCREVCRLDEEANCLCDLNLTVRNEVLSKRNKTETSAENVLNNDVLRETKGTEVEKEELSVDSDGHIKNSFDQLCPKCGRPLPVFEVVTFGLSPEEAVRELRCRIEQRTRLTASAGIAPNMMLAKVCSDKNKPNGQYRIKPTVEDVMEFIKNLPTRKISGIGKVSEKMLNAVGVHTCTQLYQQRALLYHLYSSISFNYFMRICLGIGSVTVERDSEKKSISTERTFNELSKPGDLYSKCLELCESLCEDLQEDQLKGKTVTIKLKTVKFEVKTRAHTLPDYTNNVDVIFTAAKELLKTEMTAVSPQPLRLRLMGVRMSTLLHESLCRKKQQNTLTRYVQKIGQQSQNSCVGILSTAHTETKPSEDSNDIKYSDITTAEETSSNDEQNLPPLPDTNFLNFNETREVNLNQQSDCSDMKINEKLKVSGFSTAHQFMQTDKQNCTEQNCTNIGNIGLKKNIEMLQNKSEKREIMQCKDDESNTIYHESFNSAMKPGTKQHHIKDSEVLDSCNGCSVSDQKQKSNGQICNDSLNHGNDKPQREVIDNNLFKQEEVNTNLVVTNALTPKNTVHNENGISVEGTCSSSEQVHDLELSTCPVCQDIVKCDSLSQFNQHIDVCLNRQIVKDCSRYNPEDDGKLGNKSVLKCSGSGAVPYGSPKTKSPKMKVKKKPIVPKSPLVNKSNNNSPKVINRNDSVSFDTYLPEDQMNSELPINSDEGTCSSVSQTLPAQVNHGKLICPVCFMEQTGSDLEEFNGHVDTCLSKGTITEILREQKDTNSSKSKRTISGPSSQQPSTKKKRYDSGVKTKNIQSFFSS